MTITHSVDTSRNPGGAGTGAPANREQPALTGAGCFASGNRFAGRSRALKTYAPHAWMRAF